MDYFLGLLYLIVMSVITYILFGVDKYKAVNDKWRIPERTLLLFSAFGGAIGAYNAMKAFHHKTTKREFIVVVNFSYLAQLGLFLWLLWKFFWIM